MPKTTTDTRLTAEESNALKTLAFWLVILVLALVFRHRIFSAAMDWGAVLEDQASRVFLSRHTRCLAAVSRSGDGDGPKAKQIVLRGCLKEDPRDFALKRVLRDLDLDSSDPVDLAEGQKLEDELAKERAGSMAEVEKQVRKEMARRAKLRADQR